MNLINKFILWIWLLGISLLIPISLPAGGIQKAIIETRKVSIDSPLITFKQFNLLSTITKNPYILTTVKTGTPIQVLKVWKSPETGTWLLVNVLTQSSCQMFSKRGWVNI